MDKEEFIRLASMMGYSSEKKAKEYAYSHGRLSESDFVGLYRMGAGKETIRLHGREMYGLNGRTTKSYGTMASNWWDNYH